MKRVKVIARKVIPRQTIKSVEESYRLNKARLAAVRYGKPSGTQKVIAITGTNGKTTTCTYINEVLKAGGFSTAVNTTAYQEIGGVRRENTNHMTVASVWSVLKFMSQAKKAEVDWVILEVTSHALDQYRLRGIAVEIAAITNLSQDHLDYHGTMEDYAAAKALLLTKYSAKKYVLNADDEWFDYFAAIRKDKPLTVGRSKATHQIKSLSLKPDGTSFTLVSSLATTHMTTKLVGEFNVYNAAMAVVIGQLAGVSATDAGQGIANVWGVPGRLEPVVAGQTFSVLVDYAHTPDALERVLKALKAITHGKVRVVFGATGDRDATKRLTMGKIAAQNADMIYLTDDETYTEDPAAIRAAVRQGIEDANGTFTEIADRKDAIKQAFADAEAGDVVLLAGIGHQDYRAMGGKKIAWDEREVARELLTSKR
jgi:UDP-N-acetylmuramoyl-L-alanyl-D-glutamate--2,6-diaminopimelate ligase